MSPLRSATAVQKFPGTGPSRGGRNPSLPAAQSDEQEVQPNALAGRLGLMACRSLWIQLQARSLFTLPPRQRASVKQCLIWDSGSPYLYLRTTTEGRVILGGEDEDFVNAKRLDVCISQKTRTLVEKFRRLFPAVPLEMVFAWAGTFGETKDGLAYIGLHPRFPHAYFALGYGGNGITSSLIAAEIIQDAFSGRKNPDAHLFRFGR